VESLSAFEPPEPTAFSVGARRMKTRATIEVSRKQRTCDPYGEGPDNALMFEWRPYLSLPGAGAPLEQVCYATIFQHVIAHRRVLPMSTILSYGRESRSRTNQDFHRGLTTSSPRGPERARAGGRRYDQPRIRPIPSIPVAFRSFGTPGMADPVRVEGFPAILNRRWSSWHPYLDLRVFAVYACGAIYPMVPKEAFTETGDAEHSARGSPAQGQGPLAGSPQFQTVRADGHGADSSM